VTKHLTRSVLLPDGFRAYVESLPAGTAVPVVREQLLELLPTTGSRPTEGEPDLTVAEVGQRFKRSASTVRYWITAGKLDAYKFEGRELRVTPAALAAFESRQRMGPRTQPRRRGGPVDLGAWKQAS
jgi:excisionase family DNA binding protein